MAMTVREGKHNGIERDDKPYTTGEIASFCHVTINAVKKWISSGKLNAFRTPGGHYRIERSDFKDFIDRYRLHIKDEIFPEKRKILIIDDDPAIVEYLKGALEMMEDDFEIETAMDGYEALIKVGDFKPELLILDIRMPKIDGFEVCRRLRADDKTRGTKILAVTSYGNEDMENIIRCGADQCISKSHNLKEFQKSVEKLLK
ncbi:MAG TPA: response regulator [Deltaproteobacteria bacterium]|nr:response regulator [Deltaproteobacteria bacterium]